ncbi:hypothetical protein C8R46DRAFT_1118532, partial [Mycena filopes]
MNSPPTELWLEIFHHLPLRDLWTIYAVSTSFHDIIRSRIFRDVKVELGPDRPDMEDLRERLAFFCAPPVASFVRKFTFHARIRTSAHVPSRLSLDSSNEWIVAILEALPFLVNLRTLQLDSWSNPEIDLARLGLEFCPAPLEYLLLYGCSFDSPETPIAAKIRVKCLCLGFANNWVSAANKPINIRRSFLPMIDPQALSLLDLTFATNAHLQWLRDDLPPADAAAFPNLRQLHLTCSAISCTQLHLISVRFPAVRTLVIDAFLVDAPTMATRCHWPELREYRGPSAFLSAVLAEATECSTLAIKNGTPMHLAQDMAVVGHALSVTSLGLSFSLQQLADWSSPHDLLTLLPNVTELRLRSPYREDTVAGLQSLQRIVAAANSLRSLVLEGPGG